MRETSKTQALWRTSARALELGSAAAAVASRKVAALDRSPSLQGDRSIEWSFCLARLADGPGTLDFGADVDFLSLAAAQRGHEVVALDRLPPALEYVQERVTPIQADILDRPLSDRRFD